MSNINIRLKNLEKRLARLGSGDPRGSALRQVTREYLQEPGHRELVNRMTDGAGVRSLARLLLTQRDGPLVGELRRSIGAFCRRHRYRFPGAKVIRLPRGPGIENVVRPHPNPPDGETRFLQVLVCDARPSEPTGDATSEARS